MDFSVNSKFFHFMSKVADLMILSVLWIVTSLPLITLPLTCISLTATARKCVRKEEGYAVKTYFSQLRSNWQQGLSLAGVCLGVLAAASLLGTLAFQLGVRLSSVYTVYILLSALLVGWLHYAIAYIGKFRASFCQVLKNSLVICLVNLPHTISMIALFLVAFGGWALLLPRSLLTILLLPGVYALLSGFLVDRIFKKYMQEEETHEEKSTPQT